MLYNTLVQSHINYGILLWGFDTKRISVQQNKTIRAITHAKSSSHTSKSYRELGILRIQDIFKIRCLKFYYNIVNNHAPAFFDENLIDVNNAERRTQGASKCLRLHLLNSIIPNTPPNIIEKVTTHSLDGFSTYVKTHILNSYTDCLLGPDRCYPCTRTR